MSKKRLNKFIKSRGVALIIVILALSIMLLLGLIVSTSSTTEVAISNAATQEVSAHYLAESGLNQALAMVRNIQNGDLNDLLAGPDAQCDAPCTSTWATSTGHPLKTHGNELVVDVSATGAGATEKWSSTIDGKLLAHSLLPTPLFNPSVRGFQPADTSAVESGGDGTPPLFAPCPSGSYTNCPGQNGIPLAQWAGKQQFIDPVTRLKYVTLLEVYDDDDPLSLQYNAWQYGSVTYPNNFNSSTEPIAKIYGSLPANSTADPNLATNDATCGLAGTGGDECPGTRDGRAFSGLNMDFNNRIVIRATGRILKQFSNKWRIVSESSVDAIVGFLPYPAVITGNCLAMGGNSSIVGAYGSVFSNANICVSGNSVSVEKVAGAVGSICGSTHASSQVPQQPPLFIPDLKPIPNLTAAPYDDGPQAAPFANPALTVTTPSSGASRVPYAEASSANGSYRVYAGDYWLRQIAKLPSTATSSGLNPLASNATGGYILLAPRGQSGSRRKCLDGTNSCATEDGILSRLGITEADIDALEARVKRSSGSGGNADSGFDADHGLIIRLVIKKNALMPNGSGTTKMDVIDKDRIFIASFSGGTPDTIASGSGSNKPKSAGSNATYEFYRIIPGVVAANGGNVTAASNAINLGETLSFYNNGGSIGGANANQSTSSAVADTLHGWSFSANSAGSCGGSSGTACSSCGTCAVITGLCTNPYGGDWQIDTRDFSTSGYSYFLDGNFTGSGTGNKPDTRATLIMTGHIDITGNGIFTPVLKASLNPLQPPFTDPVVQFLVGSDFHSRGTPSDALSFDGLVYCREQIDLSGNGTYNGQIVAADKVNLDANVGTNNITGSYQVNFNRTQNVLGTLNITAWRKLKF